jgi:hypothetical protein
VSVWRSGVDPKNKQSLSTPQTPKTSRKQSPSPSFSTVIVDEDIGSSANSTVLPTPEISPLISPANSSLPSSTSSKQTKQTKLVQKIAVLTQSEVIAVNLLRQSKGLPKFSSDSTVVCFFPYVQKGKPSADSTRYGERGFLILKPREFKQCDVSLTVQLTVDKDDVSCF